MLIDLKKFDPFGEIGKQHKEEYQVVEVYGDRRSKSLHHIKLKKRQKGSNLKGHGVWS